MQPSVDSPYRTRPRALWHPLSGVEGGGGPGPATRGRIRRPPGGGVASAPMPAARHPAWSDQALARDPHRDPEKAARVQAMFSAIARRYDLNNRVHSFGQDQRWRRRAVELAGELRGRTVLDVACGTGDLSEAFARAGAAAVIGVDFTPAMLDLARAKAASRRRPAGAAAPEYRHGDATALDIPDRSVDVVSIAFGLRNVDRPDAAIAEFHRVLRPGGVLVILEFDEPSNPVIRAGSGLYTRIIMPVTATLLARDRSGAYKYLPRSVATFLDRAALARRLESAGFRDVRQVPLSLGICVVTVAVRPGGE